MANESRIIENEGKKIAPEVRILGKEVKILENQVKILAHLVRKKTDLVKTIFIRFANTAGFENLLGLLISFMMLADTCRSPFIIPKLF